MLSENLHKKTIKLVFCSIGRIAIDIGIRETGGSTEMYLNQEQHVIYCSLTVLNCGGCNRNSIVTLEQKAFLVYRSPPPLLISITWEEFFCKPNTFSMVYLQ